MLYESHIFIAIYKVIVIQAFNHLRKTPKALIENKVSFAGLNSEVSIYDTYESCKRIHFESDGLMFCGMLTGRKIMHSSDTKKGQVFLPHESFVIAPSGSVEIDFPDACKTQPTSCLTIEISKEKVNALKEPMYEAFPVAESANEWSMRSPVLHTHHSTATQRVLNKITRLSSENHPDKDILIDLNISELVIRMLRHKTRDFLLAYCDNNPEKNSLLAGLDWIRSTLSKPLDIQQLCRHTCMSRSRLYKVFREQLGCSPVELQQQLRLKQAAKRIQKGESITTISYDLGFSSPSHFCTRFKAFFGCTATEYKIRNDGSYTTVNTSHGA